MAAERPTLDSIKPPPPPEKGAVSLLRSQDNQELETSALEAERAKEIHHEQMSDRRQDRGERKHYAACLYWLIVGWLIFAGVVVMTSAIECDMPVFMVRPFCIANVKINVPQPVALALIGATTLNVIGLFYVVAKYLFPSRDGKRERIGDPPTA